MHWNDNTVHKITNCGDIRIKDGRKEGPIEKLAEAQARYGNGLYKICIVCEN